MRISSRWMGLVAAWLLHGCGDSSTGEETGASTISTSNGMATASTETTTPATSIGETSSSSTTATTAADSTGAPPNTGPSEGTSEGNDTMGETAGVCEPPPPEGNACLECAVASCCDAWMACQSNEPCACVVDCHVVNGGSLGNCSNQCNLDSELYQTLYFCGQQSCLGTCEWDCC